MIPEDALHEMNEELANHVDHGVASVEGFDSYSDEHMEYVDKDQGGLKASIATQNISSQLHINL